MNRQLGLRLMIGAPGVALAGYGVFRVLDDSSHTNPRHLARWLIGAVLLNDGLLVPTTMILGFVITKVFPPRIRRYVQGALVTSAMITVIAIPLIYRRGSQPAVKALEQQNYALHLTILIALVVAVATLAYVVKVRRDHRGLASNTSKRLPDAIHDSEAANPAAEA